MTLSFRLSGKALQTHFRKRAAYHAKRAEEYEAALKRGEPLVAGGTGLDPYNAYKIKAEEHRRKAESFSRKASYINTRKYHELSSHELDELEL